MSSFPSPEGGPDAQARAAAVWAVNGLSYEAHMRLAASQLQRVLALATEERVSLHVRDLADFAGMIRFGADASEGKAG